jgi:oligopeptidase B
MLDETLHLTVHEYDEWGNPRDSREAYDYIASYCPYTLAERVDVGALPHMLAMASMRDTRVPYWQPAKLVARLRERRRDLRGLPELFLSTDWDGGHFGSGGRLEYLRDYAYEYAFLHKSMGLLR